MIISLYWRDDSLLAAKAFTSVTLVNLLTTPVLIFIQSVPSVIQSVGSFDRIQEYCNSDTLDIGGEDATEGDKAEKEKSVSELQTEPGKSQTRSVAVESQSFSWDKSKPAFLKNISLQAEGGEITMVVGPVGSGKSTLLESLLGETIGSTTTPDHYRRSIAYCAQQPWLENGTIRSNILGVAEYDRQWYRTVIAACGLETDLKQLDKGDMTIIGSKGLNLSGGQKQRIVSQRTVELHWNYLTQVIRPRHLPAPYTPARASYFLMMSSVAWMLVRSKLSHAMYWARPVSSGSRKPRWLWRRIAVGAPAALEPS